MMHTNWDSCLDSGRNELLFENRNKQFGAYVIRRDYSRNLIIAFLFTCTTACILIFLSWFRLQITHPAVTIFEKPDDVIELTNFVTPPIEIITPANPETFSAIDAKELSNPVVVSKTNPEVIVPAPTGTVINPGEILPGTPPGPTVQTGTISTGIPDVIPDPGPRKWVENMPKFPGGEHALVQFLSSRIRYSDDARRRKIEGTVYLSFVVDATGKISQIKLLHGIYPDCDAAAIQAVTSMPDWVPGNQNGQNVSVEMNLPVNFRLR